MVHFLTSVALHQTHDLSPKCCMKTIPATKIVDSCHEASTNTDKIYDP